jgi:GTPase
MRDTIQNPPPDGSPDPGRPETAGGFRCGFVALAGRANVGKSSLMNRMIGTKVSIVSDVPQTTRFPIRGILHREHCQIVFIDSPGIHKPRYRMNQEMVRMATRLLKEVDVAAVLVDADDGLGPGDRFAFDLVKAAGARALLILNKIDLMPRERLLPIMEEASHAGLFEEIVPVSAKTGENCDRLETLLVERMPPGPAHFPVEMLSDLTERLAVAEIIREQIFTRMRQEIPHAATVVVDSIERTDGGLIRIHSTILVDRDSHKGILIGEGGRMMKEIGTSSRHNLEAHLKSRVHLALWVKVRAGWRDDLSLLRLTGLPVDPSA